MTKQKREQLSALIDGEVPRAGAEQLVDDLLRDPELREEWARHHLVSDVMNNRLHVMPEGDLAASVRQAVEEEPVVVAPRRWARRRYLRPAAGLALAASVAAVAVIAVGGIGQDPVQSTQLATVNVEDEAWDGMRWSDTPPGVEARLNEYLVNHSELSRVGGHGMPPYVRVVGYDAGQ